MPDLPAPHGAQGSEVIRCWGLGARCWGSSLNLGFPQPRVPRPPPPGFRGVRSTANLPVYREAASLARGGTVEKSLGQMATPDTEKPWFCYMLCCRDQSFYVGITNDPEDRVREHNRGKDSEYTAKRRPVQLIWAEQQSSREDARRREVEIKSWSRRKKLELIVQNPSPLAQGKGASDQRLICRSPKPVMGVRVPPPLPGKRRAGSRRSAMEGS